MSQSVQSQFATDLIALASERSSEKRVELLRRVTGAYLEQDGQRSSAEQYFFHEVVSNFVDKIKGGQKVAASVTHEHASLRHLIPNHPCERHGGRNRTPPSVGFNEKPSARCRQPHEPK